MLVQLLALVIAPSAVVAYAFVVPLGSTMTHNQWNTKGRICLAIRSPGNAGVRRTYWNMVTDGTTEDNSEMSPMSRQQMFQQEAAKFKIRTCSATACAKKRKMLHMDEFSTFAAFYSRIMRDMPKCGLTVEETSCLGQCEHTPAVGIEHEDFMGRVALEGMTPNEFTASCFRNVITDEDADRVWESVKNAVQVMAEEAFADVDDDEDTVAVEPTFDTDSVDARTV